MLGAICGDIIGSIFERNNTKSKTFPLFSDKNRYTDDSVMTCAIANACTIYLQNKSKEEFRKNCIEQMRKLGRNHIYAGYGGTFIKWLLMNNPRPYNSYGNGSAMRVSAVGWISETIEEVEELAKASAEVTHSHPYGIQGAQAIASSIWLLKNGSTKEELRKFINGKYYNLNFSIDQIRENYKFDVTCQGSVPQAIVSFLESDNFEDAIRTAVSLGGDSDTIAAMAGSLAEAYYGIPQNIQKMAKLYLDDELLNSVNKFYNSIKRNENTKPIIK